MQKIKLALLLFSFYTLFSNAQTSWDFSSGLQGWHDLGDGRDVVASWDNGNLKMTYTDRAPTNGPQLWFAAIQVDNLNFSAASYPYLEIYYKANWPTVLNGKMLLTITKTDNTVVHSFLDFDPTENFNSVNIAANVRTDWGGKLYDGQIKSIQIELPHNSSAIANPATNWFGLYTLIDKIELTATQTPKPDNRKQVNWSFENNFADDSNQFVCSTSGAPAINTDNYKKGKSALYLDGNSYLTISADPFFSAKEQTITFWIKTIGNGQNFSATPANIFSYSNGNYDLALNDGKLIFQKTSRLWDNLTPWNGGSWQHIAIVNERNTMSCYINGKKAAELLNVPMTNRSGNILIGNGGLKAYIDDFSVCNYALTPAEIEALGLIPLKTVQPWTFAENTEGWQEINDGLDRDVSLSWEAGAIILSYVNKALNNGPELWYPQVEVTTSMDAALYPLCDIYYQTKDWPVTSPVKGILEMTKADGKTFSAVFDVDPAKNFVSIDIASAALNNTIKYSGEITKIRIGLPQNSSAAVAEQWFGASVKISKIEFKDVRPSVDVSWDGMLEKSAFVKSGMTKLNRVDYQYQPIGLGGTTMRVDPWGFGFTKAPMANPGSWHPHEPYLGYEYWWDNAGHRFNPFLLKAGYGTALNPGTITAFNQKLDLRTGELSIDLELNLDGTNFSSSRKVFVTPEGVLVIRVQDQGAPLPLQVNVAVEQDVRIYNNGGIYNTTHDPFTGSATAREQAGTVGTVVTATRPNTSTAALAVAATSSSAVAISAGNQIVSATEPNGTVTYFIAPASSFNPLTPTVPWDHAWNDAYAAKQKGYDTLRGETAAWWQNFFSRSKIAVPDETVQKLYMQSLYFHGVYFGNCKIPPGCNATDIESFGGAVCPEYDLVFSQLALLYTGCLQEAKNIAEWTYNVLPKAKSNAVNGLTHHNVTRKYDGGAIYTTLMGYDGALGVQPTTGEGINLYQNYPGANASLMAVSYVDYSHDADFRDKALDILKSTTYVSLKDLAFNGKTYQCKNMPNTVQQSSALYGFNECVKRGIAEPGWNIYNGKILIPETTLYGDTLIAGGAGATAQEGIADATWLTHVWYHGVLNKSDSKVLPSYINAAKSATGDYVFNNGTMGVVAAKLGLGNEALQWLQNFQKTDILYDETCFTEARGQLFLTPEIGAHGAYICNLSQMLLDPDNEQNTDVFQAIPDNWEYRSVGFDSLMTTGGIQVSAYRDIEGVKVTLKNTAPTTMNRKVNISIPRMLDVTNLQTATLNDSKISVDITLQPAETIVLEYSFIPSKVIASVHNISSDDESAHYRIFPNPNTTGELHVMQGHNVESISIYSLKGELIRQLNGNRDQYDIGGLNPGIYILKMKLNSSRFIQQILLVK